jgi:hypothetical protein
MIRDRGKGWITSMGMRMTMETGIITITAIKITVIAMISLNDLSDTTVALAAIGK